MSYAAIVVGGVSLVSSGIQYSRARKQAKRAESINPVDPGPNQALVDNANMLRDRYGNYQMPGYSDAVSQIGQAGSQAFSAASQGATSSGDVLDSAARIAYGTQQAIGGLNVENAMGRERALGQYLNANQIAGQDQTGWNRQMYLQDRQDRANLRNAADINSSNAINDGLGAISTAGAMYYGGRVPNVRRYGNIPGTMRAGQAGINPSVGVQAPLTLPYRG